MKTKLLFFFAICISSFLYSQAPVNDDCALAINLPIETANTINTSYNNTDATLSISGSCENNTYVDIWYEFTMPVTGNVRLTGAYGNDTFALFDACAGNELQCGFGNEYYYNLTQNTNYRLRVASRVDLIGNRSFNIQAFVPTVNDDCANAINIPIETQNTINTAYSNAGSTAGAQASCENSNSTYLDSWYEFTMPVTGNVRLTGAYGNDTFTLFDACAGNELQCGGGNEYYYNLAQGTTYTLRVASRQDLIGNRSFNIQAFVPTVNDDCANAINIPIETQSAINTAYSNAGSTAGAQASCENSNSTYLDSWYEFTMPVTGNVRLTGAYGNDTFALFDACAGNELQCGGGNEYYYNLTQGTTYTLRVASRQDLIGNRSFNIQAFVPTVNDDCTNAINIPIETQNTINTAYSNAGSTAGAQASCDNPNSTYLDSWYEFTMPVTGNVRITAAYGNDTFTLFDACAGNELQCGGGNEYYYNLTQGTTYTLRVASRQDLIGNRSFNIQAFVPTVNDDCANATTLTVTTANAITVNYSNQGSTVSMQASCESNNSVYIDQWFAFNMPVTGNVEISGAYGNDTFTLFDACSGNEIQCGFGNENYLNLTENTDYILRVSSRQDLAAPRSFNIQAFGTVSNDECNTAETIVIQTTNDVTISYNTAGATASTMASCESSSSIWQDLWYQFTMPVNGNVILDGANGNTRFSLYDACNGIELQCGAGNEIYLSLNQATNYILKVSSRADLTGPGSFKMQAFEAILNNDCASAISIQVAGLDECTNFNAITEFRGATPALSVGSCINPTSTYFDAWYSFQASSTGNINISSSTSLNNFAVYDACNGNEIACFTLNGTIPTVSGNTYYLQISRRSTSLDETTFCLESEPEVAPGIVNTCETLPDITISTVNGNTNSWVSILDSSGKIAAAINANGNDLGLVTSTLFIDSGDTRTSGSQHYLRREISISPQNQPTSNVMVRLYILEDEMTDLIAADSNLSSYTALELMKVSGSGCTSGYSGGGEFLTANSSLYGSDYYAEASISSFSVFYPTSVDLSGTLSIETLHTDSILSIYPTVSDGLINIKTNSNLERSKISVIDLNGREVYTSNLELSNTPKEFDLQQLNKGIYFIKVESNTTKNIKKIILK